MEPNFSGRFGDGGNVCIHSATVEVSWVALFQSAVCDK